MTELKNEQKITLSQWLFNPFQFIAGFKSLSMGLLIMAAAALIGSFRYVHFNGVLDLQVDLIEKHEFGLWVYFVEVLIDWLCLSTVLTIAGFFTSKSSLRIIDVFGTQALARTPYLLSVIAILPKGTQRIIEYIIWKQLHKGTAVSIQPPDIIFFILTMVTVILMVVWMVALMYKAYTVSCNVKGQKAIISFIAGLIAAEALSKLLIWPIIY
jgi:hypothetical protein